MPRTAAAGPAALLSVTRKVKGKTVSVALSEEQFDALTKAIETWKKPSRSSSECSNSPGGDFTTLPGTKHSKPLSKKVLGLI